jgi:hypothetical protein
MMPIMTRANRTGMNAVLRCADIGTAARSDLKQATSDQVAPFLNSRLSFFESILSFLSAARHDQYLQ